jgi:hypothetical protein
MQMGDELPQSKPDGFDSSLGEGASGETGHFTVLPETLPPCQRPHLRGGWHRAAMTGGVRSPLLHLATGGEAVYNRLKALQRRNPRQIQEEMKMNKPVLVVMAAGMGSRYGGMKQIDPVGPNGQVIMDYSLYDARRAGFETVIFVIKHEIEDAFKAAIGDRVAKAMNVKYAFQQLEELPAGFAVPEGRVKPWGTCHAVLAAKPLIDGPFAVINADDYYGPEAFQVMYDYLSTHADDDFYRYCMVSYLLKNTLSENGSVARGVCIKNEDGTLQSVTERTRIEPCGGGAHYTEDGGESWVDLPGDTPVSMNLWGFGKSFLDEAEQRFAGWLTENLPVNPLKCEYFLPLVVTELIEENKAKIQVLRSTDKWFGVTYREDKPLVVDAIARKTAEGQYPEKLWE